MRLIESNTAHNTDENHGSFWAQAIGTEEDQDQAINYVGSLVENIEALDENEVQGPAAGVLGEPFKQGGAYGLAVIDMICATLCRLEWEDQCGFRCVGKVCGVHLASLQKTSDLLEEDFERAVFRCRTELERRFQQDQPVDEEGVQLDFYDVWSHFEDGLRKGVKHPRPDLWKIATRVRRELDAIRSNREARARVLDIARVTKPDAQVQPPTDGKTASEHGVSIREGEWTNGAVQELLTRMDAEHALVTLNSKVLYLHNTQDAWGESELRFLSADDMSRLYANVIIDREGGRDVTAFTRWNRWRGRRQYHGLGMFPGQDAPKGYLNLWNGFLIEPRKGDWSLFRDHICNVLCGGDEKLFTWFMDWLAHIFQKPGDKPGSAVVLISPERGTGKSMLLEFLRSILGKHMFTASRSEHFLGKHNRHLMHNLVLGADEAIWGGDKKTTGALYTLITEPQITIEPKHVDAFNLRNFTRVIFTSNQKWVVPVGIDERRFFVLNVKNPHAKDPAYFDPIFAQMRDGGLQAMLHELLERKITSNLRNPPETDGLIAQREQGMSSIQKWILNVADQGVIFDPFAKEDIALDRKKETKIKCSLVRASAKECCTSNEARDADREVGALLSAVGVKRKKHFSGGGGYVYVFPALPELHNNVFKELKVA